MVDIIAKEKNMNTNRDINADIHIDTDMDIKVPDPISEREASEYYKIEKDFVKAYIDHKDGPEQLWLEQKLREYLPEKDDTQIKDISDEIIGSLKTTEDMKISQQKALKSGRSRESWLASNLEKAASSMSAREAAGYLNDLDDVVRKANDEMAKTITTKAGAPNQNYNLDGFIAEQHHVNSYNLKAKATGSDLHAEVMRPSDGRYAKNSVDIVIKDKSGKIVNRYQVKYGATAEDTIRMIKNGDYRGQQIIVPEDQVEAVQKAFPDRKVSSTIGSGKTKSKRLTKEEAKKLQEQAQKGNFLELDWSEFSNKDIALGVSRQVGIATVQGIAIGTGMNIVEKICNGDEIDGEEVVKTALTSGADFGVKTAVAGALKVASEKEIIKAIPKGTSANTLTNIAFVAIENVKIIGKVASGELTAKQGLDKMTETTASCVAGIAASAKGAAIGAAVGTVLGPVGAAIGGFVGGTIGYMAGSKFGETLAKTAIQVRDTAVKVVKNIGKAISGFARSIESLFSLA